MGVTYRLAEENDVWAMMAMYQKVGSTFTVDALFLDYEKLKGAVLTKESVWLVTESALGQLLVVISILLDREQGLAKISRMILNPDEPLIAVQLRSSLRNAIDYLYDQEASIDVIYSTTLTLPPKLQQVTLDEGFKILGVFPNAHGVDRSHLNGLTVYYKDEILNQKRVKDLVLHKTIYPFFKLAKKHLNLPNVQVAKETDVCLESDSFIFPELELIKAPLLVEHKFEKLKYSQSLAINFYPFYKPNALISNPDQSVEIYIKLVDQFKFAAIIGESIEIALNAVKLYEAIQEILRSVGVSYIEIINDAADVIGTDCIIRAGFTPSCYIPAFKKQGESRRDYVVFGKSFEQHCRLDLNVNKDYIDFFKLYLSIERKNFFVST